jgi:hypothetical protein
MRDWIIILVLYVLGIALFHVLGGLSAAAEAIKKWGRTSSTVRSSRVSPGS